MRRILEPLSPTASDISPPLLYCEDPVRSSIDPAPLIVDVPDETTISPDFEEEEVYICIEPLESVP